MQTFLPYASFDSSAACLDRQRLGKQRVEAYQIMGALVNGTGWVNHPATKMWRGYELSLMEYTIAVCDEWTGRGYADTVREKTFALLGSRSDQIADPPWLGDPALHASHRSNLLRKMPAHYEQFGWQESDDLPYVWPVT